ncbi:DNA (cytosine-5-)-methyltransferase [Mycoplasma nasistruthionis]|uniref:Cytosine-specific methyltransferase n=2 Tax=Mycoplasma nasistruthionis TaxID=353852 RepID=A0A5B7XW26_9MOLU|nr:DNA (cytosine-5-)-methyltransferase [Mycoplasma nasistruthionis]
MNMKTIKIFELFAGIGTQFQALKNIAKRKNWQPLSVGYIEWYTDAIVAWELVHNNHKDIKLSDFKVDENITISFDSKKPALRPENSKKLINSQYATLLSESRDKHNNLFDISKVKGTSIPKNIDIFTYSFPCQDLSHQGKQKGMNKDSFTRSGLLWQVDRILEEMTWSYLPSEMPKFLLMENVFAIKNAKHNMLYQTWKNRLAEMNYSSYEYVLDSKFFNSPQSRKRVFLLSVHNSHKENVNFEFTDIVANHSQISKVKLKDIMDYSNPTRIEKDFSSYSYPDFKQTNGIIKSHLRDYTNFNSENAIFSDQGIGPTLTASGALSRLKIVNSNNEIFIMNAQEAFRYMGFTKAQFDKVNKWQILSEAKLTFIMGNAIVIPVLEAIFETLEF